jgi:hypothetical protein
MPPGPADDCARQASREERPGGVRNAKQVGGLLVAAASENGENQDADYVDSDRWQDLHDPHITLRPWLPQPIAMSRPWLTRRRPRD